MLCRSALQAFVKKLPQGSAIAGRLYADTFALFYLDPDNNAFQRQIISFNDFLMRRLFFLNNSHLDFFIGKYSPHAGDDGQTIYNNATMAHSKARQGPPNIIVDFDAIYRDSLKDESALRNNLNAAFKNNEFKVFLQAKINLLNNKICGAEALARWQRGNNLISPAKFIPVLEKSGQITKLDLFIFEKCCKIISTWEQNQQDIVPISVNFSRKHLDDNEFANKLLQITKKHSVDPQNLVIELTENIALEKTDKIKTVIETLHRYGFVVSMDDFGSGYSSLGFLDEVHVDEIKLDRSLIANIVDNERTYAIIKCIIEMAQSIGVIVTAEGIETLEQAQILTELNCDIAQGFFYAKPLPHEKFNESLTAFISTDTKRNNLKNALVQKERLTSNRLELLNNILDLINVTIFITDFETRKILYVNEAGAKLAGKTKEELLGKVCHEMLWNSPNPCQGCSDLSLSEENLCLWDQRNIDNAIFYKNTGLINWNGRLARIEFGTCFKKQNHDTN